MRQFSRWQASRTRISRHKRIKSDMSILSHQLARSRSIFELSQTSIVTAVFARSFKISLSVAHTSTDIGDERTLVTLNVYTFGETFGSAQFPSLISDVWLSIRYTFRLAYFGTVLFTHIIYITIYFILIAIFFLLQVRTKNHPAAIN